MPQRNDERTPPYAAGMRAQQPHVLKVREPILIHRQKHGMPP